MPPLYGWTHFDIGLRYLKEKLYLEAETCFSKYLSKAMGMADPHRRRMANFYIALCIVARTRPLTASNSDVMRVLARLRPAGALPVARVLAALLVETYHDPDGWHVPSAMRGLADAGAVARLTSDEAELLCEHLEGMAGNTWEQVRRRSRTHCVDSQVPAPVQLPCAPRVDRSSVRNYFAVIPAKPPPPRYELAWALIGSGVVLFVMPFGGLVITTEWYVAVAAIVLMYLASITLTFFGLVTVRECVERRRLQLRRAAMIATSMPQPDDDAMDCWLREDVDRAIRRGEHRHRLDNASEPDRAGLIIKPQVLVGISGLVWPRATRWLAPDPKSPTGFTTSVGRLYLAQVRIGEDGKIRSSHYRIVVMFFTERRLGIYECEVSLKDSRRLAEATYSMSYDDIVKVSSKRVTVLDGDTVAANILMDRDGHSEAVRTDYRFSLILVNGRSIDVSTAVSRGEKVHAYSPVAWENANVQRSVERMVWALKNGKAA
jgi:hypothetical protein